MSLCAISGRVAENPVVSKTNGYLFEKSLILKHLELHKTCPITHTPLHPSDLLPIQTTTTVVPPRPPTALSFPQMLTTLQNEYDSMLLETFTLRQQLDLVKKDLTKQYYTLDAANRVIARLYRENKELKDALGDGVVNQGAKTNTSGARNNAHGMGVVGTSSGTSDNTVVTNFSFKSDEFITNAIDTARAVLAGKEKRGKLGKEMKLWEQEKKILSAKEYLNSKMNHDNSILLPNVQFNASNTTTQYLIPTVDTLNNTIECEKQQLNFIPTNSGTIVVISNDLVNKKSHTITTIPLPALSSNTPQLVTITGLTTMYFTQKQFPWLGDVIAKENNDVNSMSNDVDLHPSFIVSASTSLNQHFIYIFTCTNVNNMNDIKTWLCIHTIKTNNMIKSLIVHPSQKMFLALTSQNTIDYYNISLPSDNTMNPITMSNDYSAPFHSVQLPTGHYTPENLTAKYNDDNYIGEPIKLTVHPDATLLGIGYSHNGHYKLYSLAENTIKFASPITTDKTTNNTNNYPVTQIQFAQNAQYIAILIANKGVEVWSLSKGQIVASQLNPNIVSFSFDCTGAWLALASHSNNNTDNNVVIIDTKDGKELVALTNDINPSKIIVQQNNKGIMVIGNNNQFGIIQPIQ